MIYELYHKNTPVLTAEYEPSTNKFGKVLSVQNESHIPPGIGGIPGYSLAQGLQFWWQSRLMPRNRSGFRINNPDIDFLTAGANGFNLSDQYWIKDRNSGMTWERGNFYTNPFSEDIGEYITGQGRHRLLSVASSSPDLFSNGRQDKRWIIENGRRFLVKYGSPPYYEQPFNEMLASEICRRLGIPHVQYTLLVKGTAEPVIYSMCPCFIDSETEFVPAGFIRFTEARDRRTSNYDHLLRCCASAGIQDGEAVQKSLMQMNVLDYITANTDRHYGNFGFIRNAETLEWLGSAPNFDTGNAMFYEYPTSDLRKGASVMENVASRSFSSNQRRQAVKFSDGTAALGMDFGKLDGIKDFYEDLLARNPKEDAERIHLLSGLLVRRIEDFQKIIYSKNTVAKEFLALVGRSHSGLPLMGRIGEARRQIYGKSESEGILVDKYLRSIKAESLQDFETKFQKEADKMKSARKDGQTAVKSVSNDSEGMSV